ncbi:HTH-type transcriptional regulator BenM [Xylophilus ampelinus]|nr:LysR family transcriptional regulator [Variovorax sp.]VTY36991.1 HTH-type transcriptional regulator BenM [Xylophilus ampelinus]
MQVKKPAKRAAPKAAPAQPRQRAVLGQLSDMDLRLLRVFKSVVDCGGMTAAELELNIGTSTVSRHVKDLETRLGLTLCRRGRAGFALTAEGQRVYDETLRLLASVDGFRSGIDDIHGRMGGELDLALFDKTASNPQARIGEAIALFSARAPDVRLNVHVASINAIERGVIDGRFQVGVIPAHRASQSLAYADLFGETMQLYAGRSHPLFGSAGAELGWAELRRHAFAGLGYHSPNMELSHARRLARSATGYDQEAIALLILSGRYLGFLPDHYAAAFEREGRMAAVSPAQLRYDCRFTAIWRRSPQPGRATALFGECLAQAHAADA